MRSEQVSLSLTSIHTIEEADISLVGLNLDVCLGPQNPFRLQVTPLVVSFHSIHS